MKQRASQHKVTQEQGEGLLAAQTMADLVSAEHTATAPHSGPDLPLPLVHEALGPETVSMDATCAMLIASSYHR